MQDMPFSLPLSLLCVQNVIFHYHVTKASLYNNCLLQTLVKGPHVHYYLFYGSPFYLITDNLWDQPHSHVFLPNLQNLGFVCSSIFGSSIDWAC